ncbi:MAG: carbamoyl-phosphate synthase large subunit [Planctomycetaceae bacterium]|nr:carbamoyl-phosphate synthase large subunit [Planctomycetota bacterium]NUN52008.1 carbamoyl-phosphate synthase large subunit [Planctomycetaceae bacterium]
MPRREDIRSILIIGSGPIVIGQACEFDYSGTQACKALREEGYRVLLVNSNPATIMTDPEVADRTYIEPVTPEMVIAILEKEKVDAILPTLGGQTGLNTAVKVAETGALERLGVELLGARVDVIRRAEDRLEFKEAMKAVGIDLPRSGVARSMEEARAVLEEVGLPCVIRPSFTLGGQGGGIAWNREEFEEICAGGLALSMVHEILVEESVLGWKEFELEVMRDRADNCVIVCSIENLDPMGVHTGDSITVAPQQTLTDREYQRMRDAAFKCIRAVGVETGGSNVQFAVDPRTGRQVIIEMNPRVSRSSALASKATGFPIARIAAKLAVGYTLDEVANDITRKTPACFEPAIDYCVVKVPRFAFEKFPDANPGLTTTMKSVGEVMAIGRTFPEALQKALRGLEAGRQGLGLDRKDPMVRSREPLPEEEIRAKLATPNADRVFWLRLAMRSGWSAERVAKATSIDPWFLEGIASIVRMEDRLRAFPSTAALPDDLLREAKRMGFGDAQLATLFGEDELAVRAERLRRGIRVTFKVVDTCAAEFEALTPYYYSTYEDEDEVRLSTRRRVMILGSGPNRIGQGVEFDYCCVHAALALREAGYETVMVNSNPETVSTDYDTSDMLFFEPLTREDVLNVWERIAPEGVIVQLGGQTPLNIARGLEEAGVRILGTSVESIDRAEDRDQFASMLEKLGLRQAANGMAASIEEAEAVAARIGYPVLVRPSYVLGGRAMEICYDREQLHTYVARAVEVSAGRPVLVDDFLEEAIEVDVDCIADGETAVVAAVMEHIEEAGIHSGDSACSVPAATLPAAVQDEIRRAALALARELDVRGLMNVQFAVRQGEVFVLEVNPRASRTVPYVSKAIGVPVAKHAARIMVGQRLRDLGFTEERTVTHVSVKQPVFPFNRFPGVDTVLGPEMKSTGEVMGIDTSFGGAFARALLGAGVDLPDAGTVFLSVRKADRGAARVLGRRLIQLGFRLVSTEGTGTALREEGLEVGILRKIREGRPNALDLLKDRRIDFVVNTPSGKGARTDEGRIRAFTVTHGIPCITTLSGASAAVRGIEARRRGGLAPRALQDYFPAAAKP